MNKPLPSEASAVIVGGGIAGLSTAYHLAKQGWKDVVLLERKQLASGTTWHAAGLVRSNIGSAALSKIAMHSQPLFKELEDFTGQATGFKQNGSLGIADNPARFEEHSRAADFAAALGVEAHMVDAAEAGRRWPFLETGDLLGALWYPTDGQVNPLDYAMALAKGARELGVQIFENVKATGLQTSRGRISGVETAEGVIATPIAVNAAGMWAREFGALGADTSASTSLRTFLRGDGSHTGPAKRSPSSARYGRLRLLQGRRGQTAARRIRATRQALGHGWHSGRLLLR